KPPAASADTVKGTTDFRRYGTELRDVTRGGRRGRQGWSIESFAGRPGGWPRHPDRAVAGRAGRADAAAGAARAPGAEAVPPPVRRPGRAAVRRRPAGRRGRLGRAVPADGWDRRP